jgi:hypothetical protein
VDGPEGGADPIGDKWVPVPGTVKVYDRAAKSYKIVMQIPALTTLLPDFEAMVHDELLRNAHHDGLVIEGQIFITTETAGSKTVDEVDPTLKRDQTVREVLLDPAKEADVEAEQDKMPGMSQAERDFRKRMRQNVRETADEAFRFVSGAMDGTDIGDTGKKFKVDERAFKEGFFGEPVGPPPKVGMVKVTAEAIVGADLGLTDEEWVATDPQADKAVTESDIRTTDQMLDEQTMDFEVPDDLSELDDE